MPERRSLLQGKSNAAGKKENGFPEDKRRVFSKEVNRHLENGGLDLKATLECGQCFRWEALPDGRYWFAQGARQGWAASSALEGLWEDEGWRRYFDLDRDYGAIRKELSKMDPVLEKAVSFAPGIRILRQEPWEALCCFILSQNNNIPRIKGIVERLCRAFGEHSYGKAAGNKSVTAEPGDKNRKNHRNDKGEKKEGLESVPMKKEFYAFPSPEVLAGLSPEALSPLRCGFRARYLLDAAEKTALHKGGFSLEEIGSLPLPEAREALMEILGVGRKVAECTLLYGFHRLEAFPLDVWMKRAMETLFPGKSPEDFGPYGGLAQQYIFHYSRLHPELFR